jgi:hypothetical protein
VYKLWYVFLNATQSTYSQTALLRLGIDLKSQRVHSSATIFCQSLHEYEGEYSESEDSLPTRHLSYKSSEYACSGVCEEKLSDTDTSKYQKSKERNALSEELGIGLDGPWTVLYATHCITMSSVVRYILRERAIRD